MTTLGQREKCLRNHSENGLFLGVACPPDAKPTPPGAPGKAVDQNRLNPCRGRVFGLYRELESEAIRKSWLIDELVSIRNKVRSLRKADARCGAGPGWSKRRSANHGVQGLFGSPEVGD